MRQAKKRIVASSAEVTRLTPENSKFIDSNGFLSVTVSLGGNENTYDKITLKRTFPYELLWEYISVLDADQNEIGIVYDIAEFGDDKALLEAALLRYYYEPTVKSIISLKERYGFSYWKVILSDGRNVEFTMQDTYKSIVKAGADKLILFDVDTNRFVIESISALDKKSRKRIELYL